MSEEYPDPMAIVRMREEREKTAKRGHPAYPKEKASRKPTKHESKVTEETAKRRRYAKKPASKSRATQEIKDEVPNPGRRRLLFGAGALGATVLTAGFAGKLILDNSSSRNSAESPESLENVMVGGFGKHIEGYTAMYGSLTRNQVLFLDEEGAPLETVTLEAITVIEDGVEVVIEPGERANGFITQESGISQRWLDAQRQRLARQHDIPYVEGVSPRQLNIIPMLRSAVERHPALAEGKSLDELTFMDIVRFHGTIREQNLGVGDTSPLSYVRAHILDNIDTLPSPEMRDLWEEFPVLIPALGAQESQFNNDAVSPRNARGIFQFMPGTWQELGHRAEDIASLPKQISSVDRHMRQIYRKITGSQTTASLEKIKTYFSSEREFRKNFLLPVLLNSYNSGQGRMVDVINWFADHHISEHIPLGTRFEGKDLYHLMTHTAALSDHSLTSGYQRDSSEYVERIYALAGLVQRIA